MAGIDIAIGLGMAIFITGIAWVVHGYISDDDVIETGQITARQYKKRLAANNKELEREIDEVVKLICND